MTGSTYQKEPENENRIVPNKYLKNVGDRMRFRILDFTADMCVTIRTKKFDSKGFGKMSTQMMPTEVHWQMYKGEGRTEDDLIKGHDIDDENLVANMYQLDDSVIKFPLNQIGVKDSGGNKVGVEGTIYRVPVYVYEVTKAPTSPKGKPTVETLEDTFFLEVNWGIFKQLTELQEAQGGDFAFDDETLAPEYDIALVRNALQGSETWKIEGVKAVKGADGKWIDHENYRVSSEDVFGDDFDGIWENLTGTIYESMTNDFMTMDSLKYKIGPRKAKAAEQTTPIASTPLMPEDEPKDDPKTTSRRGAGATTTTVVEDETPDEDGEDPEKDQSVVFGGSQRAGRRR